LTRPAPIAAPPGREGVTWHALAPAEAMARLATSADGLRPEEAVARLARLGPNALPERRRRSAALVFLRQFASPLIYLLLAAAGIAVALGQRGDAAVILGVLLTNALIGSFQEGRAERSMEALRRLAGLRVRVRRGGAERLVESRELVSGDVLLLGPGDAVGADAVLLEASRLATLEGALTGESTPVAKRVGAGAGDAPVTDRPGMVFGGTHVAAGRGVAVVVATGAATEVGRIAALTESAEEPATPLERRLAQLGRHLAVAAVGVFFVVLAAGLARGLGTSEVLMVALSQLVSTVPEGLPVATTVALAVGMQRMARRGALVRRLAAVESLGATTVICTDKTGTLTRDELSAVAIWMPGGRRLSATGAGWDPRGEIREAGAGAEPRPVGAAEDPALAALLEAAALCNDARLVPPEAAGAAWRAEGDPTEAALLVLARKGGVDLQALARRAPRRGEVPFDAGAKMMATAHGFPGGPAVIVKGAPESVLALCADRLEAAAALAEAEGLAAGALRVLAFARAEMPLPQEGDPWAPLRGRARLLGLVGEIDLPRDEAAPAVRRCREAGIRPVMVTGDHRATGVAIARQLDIARPGDGVLDGVGLARLGPDALREEAGRVSVYARVHPEQKLRIVEAHQARGEVVAMTGDGVNDAPALARAEVGVAMGRSGSEVAKEAADVVLTDDDFATIVAAVAEGRLVYRNLRKALLLLLSTGLAEIAVLLGALLAGLPLPFVAVQILWNNVVTEGTITVNLAMEPAEGDEMQHPPVRPSDPLIGGALLARLVWMGLLISGVTLATFAWELARGTPLPEARTAAFTLLALCEWANVVNVRSERRSAFSRAPWRNPWLLAGVLASVALQAAVLYWPPLARMFHAVPLPAADLAFLALVASSVLWAEEARKGVAGWIRGRKARP
jgi:Ca2+-transporting ATPase